MVASTIPGTAKIILMLCTASHSPNHPWVPNINTKIIPGDDRRDRERQVNQGRQAGFYRETQKRVIAHDAAKPKTILSGTAIAAVRSVSLIALSPSGSVIEAK